MKKRRHNLPDKVYLILETAVDDIIKEIGEEDFFRGPTHHFVDREFRFMMREKMHEARGGVKNGNN